MEKKPLISIIIPVYNVEKYIRRCLESLFLNSIIDKCEIIIVNDCSTDNSLSVIKDFLTEIKNLENIKVYTHDYNRGSAATRNTALKQAQGKYIICVDSDDYVEDDYLESLYNKAEETNADIVGCDYFRESKDLFEKCENQLNENPVQVIKNIISGKRNAYLWLILVKRDLFTKNNITWTEGLDITEDLLICSRLFLKAKKISYLPKALYHYNLQNQSSLTASLNEKKVNQIIGVCQLLEKELDLEYLDALNQRKAFSKIWILCNTEKLRNEYFSLWNEERLYKIPEISIRKRIILFLCNIGFIKLVKLIIKIFK